MTVAREAYLLPLLFLTVTLLGGLRLDQRVQLIAPPLIAVILGLLLAVGLVRSGVVRPGALVHQRRRPLENASGVVVLVTMATASAQVFTLLTPDRGLLHLVFGTFFFVQVLTMLAGSSDRAALLRSLLVLFGAAFVLRFIVLESLYAPGGGTLTRLLTVLMEGVSLGTLQYQPNGPATGYAALGALTLYLIGLYLLDTGAGPPQAIVLGRSDRHADIVRTA